MHDLPKRAHRWHKLTACGVHFALAAVHATHALLLTADVVAFMIWHKERRKRTGRLVSKMQWDRENRIVRSEWFVIRRMYNYKSGELTGTNIATRPNKAIYHWNIFFTLNKNKGCLHMPSPEPPRALVSSSCANSLPIRPTRSWL